jgi:GWxTD domain-containing protein
MGVSARDAQARETLRDDEVQIGETILGCSSLHFYGHRQDVFPVYYEIVRLDANGAFSAEPQTNRVRYRIVHVGGEELWSSTEDQQASSGRAGRVQRFSVENYPVGTYLLGIELLDGDEVLASAYNDFQVFWTDAEWMRDEHAVLDDARVLLPPLEFEEFERKSPGERAAHLIGLWASLDPSPATPVNEARNEFQERLRVAEERFGGLEGGALSDRGRLYVRYGPPDETTRVAVPSRSDNLYEVLAAEVFGSLAGIVDADDPRLMQFLRHNTEGNPSFEIWKYDGGGRPLIPTQKTTNQGIAFVLVDQTGTGMYSLGYSSVGDIMN